VHEDIILITMMMLCTLGGHNNIYGHSEIALTHTLFDQILSGHSGCWILLSALSDGAYTKHLASPRVKNVLYRAWEQG